MALNVICSELEDMDVTFTKQNANLSKVTEIVIPITDVSSSKARQIEYVCTSNEGIVTKNEEEWIVQNL